MDFLLKLCVLHLLFLNFYVHTRAQNILGAMLEGIQNGLNVFNNVDVENRYYPDYGPPGNKEVSSLRFNDVSESNQNQNDSGESDNSNSEQRQRGDSNSNSGENDEEYPNSIENKIRIPVNDQMINNIQRNSSRNIHPEPFKAKMERKIITRKPALFNNQKPLPSEKDRFDKKNSMTHNKNCSNSHNVTTKNNNGNSTTSTSLVVPVNRSVFNNNIPKLSVVNDSLFHQNKTSSKNCKHPVTDKTLKKDKKEKKDKKDKKVKNKNVLKPLTKRKFYFQAKPVIPLSEEVSTNETIYFID